jgi:hypothetical protein
MEERIRKIEQDILKLKAAYEQYFAGIERMPPDKLANKVAREVRGGSPRLPPILKLPKLRKKRRLEFTRFPPGIMPTEGWTGSSPHSAGSTSVSVTARLQI